MITAVWRFVAAPFRWLLEGLTWANRAAWTIIGMVSMVLGVAFCAGAFYWLGLPLFLAGAFWCWRGVRTLD